MILFCEPNWTNFLKHFAGKEKCLYLYESLEGTKGQQKTASSKHTTVSIYCNLEF